MTLFLFVFLLFILQYILLDTTYVFFLGGGVTFHPTSTICQLLRSTTEKTRVSVPKFILTLLIARIRVPPTFEPIPDQHKGSERLVTDFDLFASAQYRWPVYAPRPQSAAINKKLIVYSKVLPPLLRLFILLHPWVMFASRCCSRLLTYNAAIQIRPACSQIKNQYK